MPRKPGLSRTQHLAGGAALAALAAACGPAGGGAHALGAPSPRVTQVPSNPTYVPALDPGSVGGLTTRTVSADSPGRNVHATYPEVSWAPALGTELGEIVADRVREFEKTTPPATSAPSPELNIDWQLVAHGDDVLAVRLRTSVFSGAGGAESSTTVWYDARDGRAHPSAALLAGEAGLAGLTSLVRADLTRPDSGADRELVDDALQPDPEVFDSLAFNVRGDLVAEFDEYQFGPGSAGELATAVPRLQAEPLLSPLGRRALKAAAGDRSAGVPAPTPAAATPRAAATASATPSGASAPDCAALKCVALTFDDGPGPDTPRLLDTLRSRGVRATFFTVGTNAAAEPETLRRMRDEGHVIGNHSWSHRNLAQLSRVKIADQLERTQNAVRRATGEAPSLMRPPYGATDADVTAVNRRLGLTSVLWTVDPMDWRDRDAATVARRVVRDTRRGSIVLLHDIHRGSVDAVPGIIDRLAARGFTFVTVPELGAAPGRNVAR
ncbi:polysaccharide deacetylase family protein [Bailinhaonella thermotolerans]|uniref:Polysaccharide deacetylase family protein n=1 Tax=Bailinhaonella thermotolerans TaxID=1070861 RepID=A0A3A4B6A3_9ACTN|nr:polysaccharide deacetylase family protein [Bailinhaonella thermotolerans]RJL33054.1 polysaccharide deacetylase family protein [Bailinhaonella thermotolerans]